MKMMWGIVAVIGVLSAAPAVAGDFISGQGYTNIWSSAQGTSDSYGNAAAKTASGSTTSAIGGGGYQGTLATLGGLNSVSSSFATTMSNGSGYAQAQTSGYTGGSATGSAGRSH